MLYVATLHRLLGTAVFCAALIALSSGCGGDDDAASTATTAPPATSTRPPASAATSAPVSTATPLPAARLTLEALKNAEYPDPSLKQRFPLHDGVYYIVRRPGETEQQNPAPVQANEGWRIGLVLDILAYGDLNADGREDAALISITQTGGSGRFVNLIAVLNRNGAPDAVAAVFLGDRVAVKAAAIQSGVIVLDMLVHPPITSPQWQGLCCPNQPAVQRYRLTGTTLVEE